MNTLPPGPPRTGTDTGADRLRAELAATRRELAATQAVVAALLTGRRPHLTLIPGGAAEAG